MKLQFIGADHEVTGSCHYMQIGEKHVLVDYGMEQGVNPFENCPLPVDESQIDYVFLTHAHIDHSGMLPQLFARGFRGSIYATEATADLCSIMLRDCAHIQMQEAEWKNRKAKRHSGIEPHVPVYTMEDAMETIHLIVPCAYNKKIDVCEGISIRFTDIGHLLGSSSIEVWATEGEISKKIVFSGDIGNVEQPLLRDPQPTAEADYVVMESTYGDRYHGAERPDYVGQLARIVQETFDRGGNVVIPSFAVGRTQEMLYFFRKIKEQCLVTGHGKQLARIVQETFDRGGNVVIPSFAVGRTQEMLYFFRKIKEQCLVTGHGNFPVYVDSPLAVEATRVFNENEKNCFDKEAMELVNRGVNPISFPGLRLAVTSDESIAINFDDTPKVIISASGMCKEAMELVNRGVNPISFPGLRLAVTSDESIAINFDDTPKVIISASGMCDAGRVRHHLKHNLWRSESTILFVGYQAVGIRPRLSFPHRECAMQGGCAII